MITANPGNWLFVVIVHQPFTSVVLDERAVDSSGVELNRSKWARDLHDVVGLGDAASTSPHSQTPLYDTFPPHSSCSTGAVIHRLPGVDDDVERVVVDHHELGRVSGELARLAGDGGHRLADVAHLAHGERVVLHAPPGSAAIWKNGSVRIATSSPVSVPYTPGVERGADVDRLDPRMGVRRAHEVDVPHPVALDVVEERALALDEPAVLPARHVLPDEAFLQGGRPLGLDGGHTPPPPPAATTASTMFQYGGRQMFGRGETP